MACRGVHFALDQQDLTRLLNASTDEERLSIVQEEIEQRWNADHLCETDKAWDAIHRCLTNGTLRSEDSSRPLDLCILGGQSLYSKDNYIIRLIHADEVSHVAQALQRVDDEFMRRRYYKIDPQDYGFPLTEDDCEYTLAYFAGLKSFFRKAAADGRAVIFTVDQ